MHTAKEKATYLLESIGESLGPVLSIEEIPEQQSYCRAQDNLVSNSMLSSSSAGNNEPTIDNVLAIKLRYEVKAKFAIK